MLHKAWSSIEEVPYCFWRSSVKFQGHTALKIIKFDPNWVFPDCNSSLNSPMAMKCCTKLETAKDRCPIVFQCHPSNFKVTRYKTSPILTQIGHFRTVGWSQLSNPSDLPCSNSFHELMFILRWNVTRSHWWVVSIGSGNGLLPLGNKPLPEPMMTQICVTIWYHLATMSQLPFWHWSVWKCQRTSQMVYDFIMQIWSNCICSRKSIMTMVWLKLCE